MPFVNELAAGAAHAREAGERDALAAEDRLVGAGVGERRERRGGPCVNPGVGARVGHADLDGAVARAQGEPNRAHDQRRG